MIRQENYYGHHVGAIYVQGLHDEKDNGYFQAFVEIEPDPDTKTPAEIIRSTSKKGFFVAVANLCKKLEKRTGHAFTDIPSKWQVYLIEPERLLQVPFFTGYVTISRSSAGQQSRADFRTYTFLTEQLLGGKQENDDEALIEEHIRRGILNSIEDSMGKTDFGALGNLCTKLHHYGFAQTIDSIILDPLAASFFLPAALNSNEE